MHSTECHSSFNFTFYTGTYCYLLLIAPSIICNLLFQISTGCTGVADRLRCSFAPYSLVRQRLSLFWWVCAGVNTYSENRLAGADPSWHWASGEEARVPRENPYRHEGNKHIQHKKALLQLVIKPRTYRLAMYCCKTSIIAGNILNKSELFGQEFCIYQHSFRYP